MPQLDEISDHQDESTTPSIEPTSGLVNTSPSLELMINDSSTDVGAVVGAIVGVLVGVVIITVSVMTVIVFAKRRLKKHNQGESVIAINATIYYDKGRNTSHLKIGICYYCGRK